MSAAPADALPPEPTPEQRLAADPATSAWVGASAGTGKTRVLADRVLRLLLEGTPPQRILCITFTKAAAAEMLQRIDADLGTWARTADEGELSARIARLTGSVPGPETLARARRLFATVLDVPGGMPVQTIHSFCQSLLRRFPLEAGVAPHFDVIDDRSAAQLRAEAQAEVLARRDAETVGTLTTLAEAIDEQSLAEGLKEIIDARARLATLMGPDESVGGLVAQVHEELGVPEGETESAITAEACEEVAFDRSALQAAAAMLSEGSKTDQARAAAIGTWLAAELDGRVNGFPDYCGEFLKADGGPQARLTTKKTQEAEAALRQEQERLVAVAGRLKAVTVAVRTAAILRLAGAVLEAYEARKRRAALLDYEDLIRIARDLLRREGVPGWVLYKLDGGLDNILVDEGQDTSPAQWEVVDALVEEFFAGEGARAASRTLFVVGDEKQSIYSFQGADIESFRHLRRRFADRAAAAGLPWCDVPLDLSFRSTEAVLAAVDAVFARPEARDGVLDPDATLHHRTSRTGEAGRVEVWPLVEHLDDASDDDALPPRTPQPEDDPKERLAAAVAGTIAGWLRDGEPLEAGGRPIRAGDILVLLPRRGDFQPELVRALKREAVPVAGADRMALTGQLAVMDLMALGDAVLLPEDDLTLAAVLKSPIFGLDEEGLFDLARDRGNARLADRLRAAAADDPHLAEMHERFTDLRRVADFMPPYEFYANLLGAGGGRRRIRARLGAEAMEPIEVFLAQALLYERAHPPSLQGFLRWLRMEGAEVRRDPEQPRDEVRIMTVHGAKGLEAPVVILPDTTYRQRSQDHFVPAGSGRLPLWRMREGRRDPVSAAAAEAARERQEQEFRRLLYVALTRARDRLYVCGWRPRNHGLDGTWYTHVRDALAEHADVEKIAVDRGHGVAGEGLRLLRGTPAPPAAPEAQEAPAEPVPEPSWLRDAPVPEPVPADPLAPSHIGDDDPPAASPLAGADENRFAFGLHVHRLLQHLPDLPDADRDAAIARYLETQAGALPQAMQGELAAQVRAVLEEPALAPVFGPGSRAEVPVTGIVGGQVVSGQIDRIVVTAEAVLVVDFKSNRAPPKDDADVPAAYLRQMAAYRELLRRIYPGRDVRCALVWTRDGRISRLADALLDPYMPAAADRGIPAAW